MWQTTESRNSSFLTCERLHDAWDAPTGGRLTFDELGGSVADTGWRRTPPGHARLQPGLPWLAASGPDVESRRALRAIRVRSTPVRGGVCAAAAVRPRRGRRLAGQGDRHPRPLDEWQIDLSGGPG